MNDKNSLEAFVDEIGMDPIEAMNTLMSNGIVSDNAVELHDVAEVDCVRAVKFLDGLT